MGMTNTDTVTEASDLRRRYGEHEAVRGIDLRVCRVEVHALLGTNGAGKTSTVELLLGLRRPDGGTVRVFGQDPVRDRAQVRPRTAAVLQDGGLSGLLTVEETVQAWASFVPHPRPAGEALALVELADRRGVRVEQLSGGERRRLELALALLGRPEVLFLDEPTTGMDPTSRRRTWTVIDALRRGGTTVVLTTHYLEEAEALADRVTIMVGGRVAATGTPDDVVATLPARITVRDDGQDMPQLPHAVREADGVRVVYRTRALQHDLTRLLAWAGDHDLPLTGLSARPASLEDLFHTLASPTPIGDPR